MGNELSAGWFKNKWLSLLFSERYAVARPSVVCLSSVTFVHYTQPVKILALFLRHLVPWPSSDMHRKFYGDRPRGTPPSGGLNATGVAKYSEFGRIEDYISETVQDRRKLVLITNSKSYMSFRLVPKSVTLNDLERLNGPYFALFHWIFMYDVAKNNH